MLNLFGRQESKPSALLKAYTDDGVAVSKSFFTSETRAKLTALSEHVLAGVATGAIGRSGQFTSGVNDSDMAFLRTSPEILDFARQVLGPNVTLLLSRILMKDQAFSGHINHHQDWPYFGGDTKKLSFFIPLTRCNEENGQLVFYKGSHKMGPVERGDIDVKRYPEFPGVVPDVDLGDVLVADILTWHASVPATVVSPRIMIQMIVCPADDPVNSDLLTGSRTNPYTCPTRLEPMRAPASNVSVQVARENFGRKDYAVAERICRGLIETESDNFGAFMMLYDLDKIMNGGVNCEWYMAQVERIIGEHQAEVASRKTPAESAA
jgi:ectoine hydroxylase-related dioxygenase (phytanoyl-CoA dioxygenase family)